MPRPLTRPHTMDVESPQATDDESIVDKRGLGRVAPALLVLLIPIFLLVLGVAAPAASGAGAQAPVTETDRQLLIKVRQAGLWEIPAGQQAQQQAASQVVKEVGATIAAQHETLDEEVRAVAGRLGVALPSEPSEEQQGWLDEMSTKFGPEFDQAYAQLLRAAHGKVFSIIAQVRAGTRNEAVREFATKANEAVKTHMALLESTGQVNFESLPEPAIPGVTSTQHDLTAGAPNGGVSVALVVLICLMVFGMTLGVLRALRSR